jgi:hypothetical protein
VLVKFNAQGVATEVRRIDSDDALWRQLLAYTRDSETSSKFDQVQLPSDEKKYSGMILGADSIKLNGAKERDTAIFALSAPVVIRLRPVHASSLSTPELTCFRIELGNGRTGFIRTFTSCAPARSFMQMLGYLDRLPPPAVWQDKP